MVEWTGKFEKFEDTKWAKGIRKRFTEEVNKEKSKQNTNLNILEPLYVTRLKYLEID